MSTCLSRNFPHGSWCFGDYLLGGIDLTHIDILLFSFVFTLWLQSRVRNQTTMNRHFSKLTSLDSTFLIASWIFFLNTGIIAFVCSMAWRYKPIVNKLLQGCPMSVEAHVRVALSYILDSLLHHLPGFSRTPPGPFVLVRAPPGRTSPLRRGDGETRLRLLAGFSWRPWRCSVKAMKGANAFNCQCRSISHCHCQNSTVD